MLSSKVSIEKTSFDGSFQSRFREWLWRKHSVQNGVLWASALGVGLYLSALAISGLCDIPTFGSSDEVEGIPTLLVAAAAYSGALFGFLQAVAIFAVQLRSQQDTSMLPLTPLIARRYHSFFILGSVAGVCIANLIASFATPLLPFSLGSLAALTWIDLFAVPLITLAALWYLTSIVAHAGEADLDVALPVLRATMRDQAFVDAWNHAMLNEYGQALDLAGIKYDPFVNSGVLLTRHVRRIPFGRSGEVRNLDCIRLVQIRQLLSHVDPAPNATVTVAYGQELDADNALHLTWDRTDALGTAPSPPAIDDKLADKIGSVLNGSFYVYRGSTE